MTININEDMEITVISGGGKITNKTIGFVIANKIKKNPCVMKAESLTMEEYVPIIYGKATIPDCFDVCSTCELTIIVNKNGTYYETDKVRVRMN